MVDTPVMDGATAYETSCSRLRIPLGHLTLGLGSKMAKRGRGSLWINPTNDAEFITLMCVFLLSQISIKPQQYTIRALGIVRQLIIQWEHYAFIMHDAS